MKRVGLIGCGAIGRPVALLAGESPSAEARYRGALALAESRCMRPLVPHCHRGLARLSAQVGKVERADKHLRTAAAMYREMDLPFRRE